MKKSVELERENVNLKERYDDLQKEAEKYRILLREEKRTKVSLEEKRKGISIPYTARSHLTFYKGWKRSWTG